MIKIKGILVLVYLIFSISKSNCQISYAENLYGLGMYLYTVAREDLNLIEFPQTLDTSIIENRIRYEILIEQRKKVLLKSNLILNTVVKKYPRSKYAIPSLEMVGSNLMRIGDTANAIKKFHRIVSGEFEEHQKDSLFMKKTGKKYFPIKRSAYYSLTNYHIRRKEYEIAEKYFDQVKKHPNRHWCGNGAAKDQVHMDYTESLIINGVHGREMALKFLIPKSFPNSLTNNQKLVSLTGSLLTKVEPKNLILEEYLNSAKTPIIKEIEFLGETVFIKFKEVEIQLPFQIDPKKGDLENQIIQYLKRTPLFKYLND